MRLFDEIYEKVEESSHETAFNRDQARVLYSIINLNKPKVVVEIGVQFGRSATVLAELQKVHGYDLHLIDGWAEEEYSNSAREHFKNQAKKHDWKFTFYNVNSDIAIDDLKNNIDEIDFIHIDGGHEYEEVKSDILLYTPLVKSGGFVVFDDYGHDSLPGVFQACEETMTPDKFEFIGRYANKTGVYRKL